MHERKQSIHICSDEGILCCFSPATLTFEKDAKIGYSIVEIDLDSFAIKISTSKYDKVEKVFYPLPVIDDLFIPVNSEKKDQNNFRQTLRKKHLQALKRANELFVSNNNDNGKGFIDLFTDPVIKSKSKAQIAERKSDSQKVKLSTIKISEENYVIYGKDKSGKTSILYKSLLDLLKEFNVYKILPLYIDCKELKTTTDKINFYNLLANFYELNTRDSENLPNKYKIKLLLDNYDPTFDDLNEKINDFLNKNKNVSFIVAAEETLLTSFDRYKFDGRQYKDLFIHDISRTEVRSLANKWPNLTPIKRELILDKIFNILAQLNIPANYWTVSLFIWVFEKNQEANIRNNFELIQYYIDDLLDKDKLIHDKSLKIEFEDFKIYLSQLAHFLITEHTKESYTATYSEIVIFTTDYINKNRRFVITVENLLAILIDKGILRKNSVDRYTIRLTGVFEYFIAYFMRDNDEFRNSVISDHHYYLSFSNELELCAGFIRRDKEFVDKIYLKTQSIFAKAIETYTKDPTDRVLESTFIVDVTPQLDHFKKEIKGALPESDQDEILSELQPVNEQSEVTLKKFYDSIESTATNLEKALFILCRVFRNSSLLDDSLNDKILNYILDATCTMGFLLIDEIKYDESIAQSEKTKKMMTMLLSTFMPLIVQTFLYDSLAQNNLERIIIDKIHELKRDGAKNNQFKLLLLYFTLIDLDIKQYKELITQVTDCIKIGVLKQTILIKLYSYLLFKCSPNTPIEDFIKLKITEQSISINNKVDKTEIQKNLSRLTNSKRINK